MGMKRRGLCTPGHQGLPPATSDEKISPAPTRLPARVPLLLRPDVAGIHDGLQRDIVQAQHGQPGAISSRQGLHRRFIERLERHGSAPWGQSQDQRPRGHRVLSIDEARPARQVAPPCQDACVAPEASPHHFVPCFGRSAPRVIGLFLGSCPQIPCLKGGFRAANCAPHRPHIAPYHPRARAPWSSLTSPSGASAPECGRSLPPGAAACGGGAPAAPPPSGPRAPV
jgi:hypothetical protein